MEKAKSLLSDEIQGLNSILLSTLDESIFFGEMSRFFQGKLAADRVLVFKSYDDHSGELVADSGNPIKNGKRCNPGEGLSSYVNRTKRAYYSNNVTRDPLFSQFKLDEGIVAELCIPISCQGSVLATLHFQSTNENRDFSQEDIDYVIKILSELERPILNMKMYLSAKHLNQALLKRIQDREKEIAEENASRGSTSSMKIKDVEIIGNSTPIKELMNMIEKVAASNSNTLIYGESGTGKELVSKKIHCLGMRNDKSFVAINCGALQESLLESELFGHVKGSFTGAIADKIGLIEKASGGTLFLDEVAELSPIMQTKLLRFLQEGEAYQVGSNTPYKANVRVIAATNKDLKTEVEEGRFREDLYYRLGTIKIDVPALRERGDDIQTLASHFLNLHRSSDEQKVLTSSAIKLLNEYSWPGNIRELQNIMERAYIMCDGKFIEEGHLPEDLKHSPMEEPKVGVYREMTLEDIEREHIILTLEHLNGNKTKSAKALGITVKTLYNKLHSYGMIPSRDNA